MHALIRTLTGNRLTRAGIGILLIAAFGVVASFRLGAAPTLKPEPAVSRVPDALGASLARSFAEGSRTVLRAARSSAVAGCEAAIADADAAAYRAAEAARGPAHSQGNATLILASEDAYLGALRHCIRDARPLCQAGQPPVGGCERVRAVREADLGSIRALRAAHGG